MEHHFGPVDPLGQQQQQLPVVPGLRDFFLILQQSQQSLQDMLVDLASAKVEADLANNKTAKAEAQARAVEMQMHAAQQQCAALESALSLAKSR